MTTQGKPHRGLVSQLPKGLLQSYGVPADPQAEPPAPAKKAAAKKKPAAKKARAK